MTFPFIGIIFYWFTVWHCNKNMRQTNSCTYIGHQHSNECVAFSFGVRAHPNTRATSLSISKREWYDSCVRVVRSCIQASINVCRIGVIRCAPFVINCSLVARRRKLIGFVHGFSLRCVVCAATRTTVFPLAFAFSNLASENRFCCCCFFLLQSSLKRPFGVKGHTTIGEWDLSQ